MICHHFVYQCIQSLFVLISPELVYIFWAHDAIANA